MLNAAQNLCPATARAKETKQWHLGAHGSPKGAQKEHLGGLLATFYGPGEKSENGAPAYTGASKSRFGRTLKSMIWGRKLGSV